MTMGGEKTGRSLYLYSENPVYDASPSIWLERGSPQDIQTPLEKVFGTPPKMPKIPFQEVFGCARIVKASKDCNKHSQAFHVGVSTVHSVQEFTNCPGFRLIFCWSSSIPSKGYQSLCWTQHFPKRDSWEKNTRLFLQKKNHESKKNQFTQSNPWLLRHVFPVVVCEAWFQILAGESHVADLAAAPGCRDPQGGSRGWGMSDEWVYDITMKKIHQVYEGITRWWFQIFFMFTPIWGRFPFWLIFLRWVETTKQIRIYFGLWTPLLPQDAQKNAPNAGIFGRFWSGWNPGNPKRLKPEPLPRERREI